jgi:NAD(P)-dependent dehydrogenase (short-subunit alcohol dehydrogenase family)
VDHLLERVMQDFPRIDILVNNAGMTQEGQAEAFTTFDRWRMATGPKPSSAISILAIC